MRILIAPDKFKGSLSALEVARAIGAGVREARPDAEMALVPVADGGEGTAACLTAALGGRFVACDTVDALGRPIRAEYAVLPEGTAVVELAAASGLGQIEAARRDPIRATTRGTGHLLATAIRSGAPRIWVGVGGSATNDGGAGLVAALGVRFLDAEGREFDPVPEALHRLDRLDSSGLPVLPPMTLLCDVRNPLLGPDGATRVFGPQKGVTPALIPLFERALDRFAEVCAVHFGVDHRRTPGSGAAGGAAFGLLAVCAASIRSGFDAVAEAVRLEERIRWADRVISGEGRLDAQTAGGKAPAGVAALAARLGRPVDAVTGEGEVPLAGFGRVRSAAGCALRAGEPGGSFRDPGRWVRAAAAELAREW